MNIGFFDSGIGGFHVMERVMQHMPQYNYVFYGDTKNVPYGDKSEKEIYRLVCNAVLYLFSAHNAQLVIIACNTASAETLRKIQNTFLKKHYPTRKVLGVIIPTVEIVYESGFLTPLLIGTTRTIASQKYEKELKKFGSNIELLSRATPHLVPLIERGELEKACTSLYPLIDEHIENGGDSLILGCTHYALLTPILQKKYAEKLRIISQEEIIPHKLEEYLTNHSEIESILSKKGEREVLWSA